MAADLPSPDPTLQDPPRRSEAADQTLSDADQTRSDEDQTLSDADQTSAAAEQRIADRDQEASDRDQETADRAHAADHRRTPAGERAYVASRGERQSVSVQRTRDRVQRSSTARDRDTTSRRRDRASTERDKGARARDTREAVRFAIEPDVSLRQQLEELAAHAAADRAQAAVDRARAAKEREKAARERARLEAELDRAHLDDLTGAYRREVGRLALSHEIDRARRSDGRFVLAFVDVDRLKEVNDRDGHAAGDRVLQTVVDAIRTRLRSFDPIVRYGGDEFVCGLGGTDLDEAQRRFDAIGVVIQAETTVGISVGLAALGPGDTPDDLTERADARMLEVKALHHADGDAR